MGALRHWGGDAVVYTAVQGSRAVEQRDAADEGRLEPSGTIMVGPVIVNQGKVVRPSQLIASVRQTLGVDRDRNARAAS